MVSSKHSHLLIKTSLFVIVGLSFFVFFNVNKALAINTCSSGWQISDGQTKQINCHGVCKKVTNNCGKSIFIPTKTSTEWSEFRTHNPTCVSLSSCCTCTPGTTQSCTKSCSYKACVGNSCDTKTTTVSGTRTCQSDCTSWSACSASCPGSECTYDSDCHSVSCDWKVQYTFPCPDPKGCGIHTYYIGCNSPADEGNGSDTVSCVWGRGIYKGCGQTGVHCDMPCSTVYYWKCVCQ